ncbi:MAG: hypothetical protein FJ286_04345 [Planctomycetes bacterium]|nr:hypothetical protein [Planctomycetota bacterium]
MSLSSNQRRDQRRRLVVSWKRSADGAAAAAVESPRVMAAYEPGAHPEKQRGPAVLLPTGLGGLSLAVAAILLPLAGAIAASTAEQFLGHGPFTGGGRFARTVAAAGALFDARGVNALQSWLAQAYLLLAAGVALIVRLMRRHRRDDFKGRFRAWGWMAAVLAAVALAGAVPVGRLVAAVLADSTGVVLGPGGIGWWIVISSAVVLAVALWAVLPLHERLATAFLLGLALGGWGTSAAATWLADGRERVVVAGAAAWSLAAGFALVAMLAAARSVIREVRGQCGVRKPKAEKPAKPVKADVAKPTLQATDEDEADAPDFQPLTGRASGDDSETEYTDGSEQEHRHLSKAERKRLRKLARMNGAAA